LESGLTLTGLLQSANEKHVTLVDATAKLHQMNRIEIEDIRANSVSLMPAGVDKLGKDKLQDLVAFLSTEDEEAKKNGRPTGVIQRDFWLDVLAGGLKSLMKLDTFPDNATGSGLLTRFESPVN
ncbi:MAG: hypothetical protein O2856_04410, partial [Planctomycetota bacterium]|nr:hypothetical protein [Planctomycetota bacterium]